MNYYALLYSHDGVLVVELEEYSENVKKILEEKYVDSLGGIIKGEFIGEHDLGCHMESFTVKD